MYNSFDPTPGSSRVSEMLQNRELEMSPRQAEIYRNLGAIGPEIAAFYRSGLRLLQDNNLEASAYLLAHLAREIGGGLTDVLGEKRKEELEVTLQTADGRKLTDKQKIGDSFEFDVKVPGTVKLTYKKVQGGHKDSILQFLGTDENSLIANRWIDVAKRFAKFAHRHGAWKSPRRKEVFVPLWDEFENVLADLVGSHFKLLSRLDRILKLKEPNKKVRQTLPNLLASDVRREHFFTKLDSPAWLKPLEEDGWFNPEQNPAPQEVAGSPGNYHFPIWYALEYVERIAKHPDRPQDVLVKIVNNIVNNTDASRESIGNSRTAWRLIEIIGTLPVDRIEAQHIAFIGTALKTCGAEVGLLITEEVSETILPKLLKADGKELTLALLKVILDEMDAYSLKDTVKNSEQSIARLCSVEAAELGLARIRTLIAEESLWFNLIQLVEGDSSNDAYEGYPEFVVRFTCSMLRLAPPDSIAETVGELLQESRQKSRAIFGLIALNAIRHHYADLKALFWEWPGNPLEEVWLKPGLYDLIQKRCTAFSDAEIEQLLHWIESAQYAALFEDAEKRTKSLAHRKREWLSALLETGSEKVLVADQKYEQINPEKLKRPGLNFWTETVWGDPSPVTVEKLSGMSNAEISAYLNSFKEEPIVGPSVPTELGLGDTLEECVATDPERFTENLLPFQDVPPLYQSSMLQGFRKAWRDKKDFDWEALLEFIDQLLSSEEFWAEPQNPRFTNYRAWILSATADLIAAGTENDEHAFDVSLLPLAEQILFVLVEKVNPSVTALKNLHLAVPNSGRGKVFRAMINYALRFARTNAASDNEDIRWPHSIRADFTKRLDRQVEYSLEFSFTLGAYLPNLFYLDKEWVIANVARILPQEDDVHWDAAFLGYLFYSGQVYSDLYYLLKEHGHYQKALDTDFDNEMEARRFRETLVTHICVSWIEEGAETLDDETSLIYQLINRGSSMLLSDLIHFFSRRRDALPAEMKEKVLPTWCALLEALSRKDNAAEYQDVLSRLSGWAALVDKIDMEVLNWLKLSAKSLKRHDTTFFVEALRLHVSKTPKEVGKLYLEMLADDMYPYYAQTDIEETVRVLYRAGQKQVADQICNLYGQAGFDFLRALYDEHQH